MEEFWSLREEIWLCSEPDKRTVTLTGSFCFFSPNLCMYVCMYVCTAALGLCCCVQAFL